MAIPFGILNIDKPAGSTSRDVVNQIERLTPSAKCGHAGTLDPLATGVLVVCVGRATRLIQYVQRMPKRYRGTFLLGRRSVTDDVEGDVETLADAPVPTRSDIEAALPQFRGEISQRPPAHSAIKVGGKRAYEMARRGEEFELPARSVTVHSIEILRYEYPELETAIECGSGTYIRSLGRDLASELGTSAVMSSLVRTATGDFRVDDAVPLDQLTTDSLQEHLQPALSAVAVLPQVKLGNQQLEEIRHGRPIAKPISQRGAGGRPVPTDSEWAAVNANDELVAILFEKHPGQLWPRTNFIS